MSQPLNSQRLSSIDALRGLIILVMLVDHVRETFYLHHQVSDPMPVDQTEASLFWSRIVAHLCAPLFVFLTGISAFLFQQKTQDLHQTRIFLFKRGMFLILLELSLVNFAWTAQFPPTIIYLQVIWAIGIAMLVLAMLIGLTFRTQLIVACLLIATHNLVDGLNFNQPILQNLWYLLHQRGWIEWGQNLTIRTSYPVLPWIGVIVLGYVCGQLYHPKLTERKRRHDLYRLGFGFITLFVLLRVMNIYGDQPWLQVEKWSLTVMSFFNLTKYPPSLLFILWNLGVGLILLAAFEKYSKLRIMQPLIIYGSVPMFFYLVHLYVLKLSYLLGENLFGHNHGTYFGVSAVWQIWAIAGLLSVLLFPLVRWFALFKHSHPQIKILKYF